MEQKLSHSELKLLVEFEALCLQAQNKTQKNLYQKIIRDIKNGKYKKENK